MQERTHTLNELKNIEHVREFLINKGAIDADGFNNYITEIS